jgi:hypothetical protein
MIRFHVNPGIHTPCPLSYHNATARRRLALKRIIFPQANLQHVTDMIDSGASQALTRSIKQSLSTLGLEVAWRILSFGEYPGKVVISFGSG